MIDSILPARTIDSVLRGIPCTLVRACDILVSGHSDEEHLFESKLGILHVYYSVQFCIVTDIADIVEFGKFGTSKISIQSWRQSNRELKNFEIRAFALIIFV